MRALFDVAVDAVAALGRAPGAVWCWFTHVRHWKRGWGGWGGWSCNKCYRDWYR